jgi:transcriptional regulator with XRE-family HTH domain
MDDTIARVRQFRLEHHLSFGALARLVGLSDSTLYAVLERGQAPTARTLFRLQAFAAGMQQPRKKVARG